MPLPSPTPFTAKTSKPQPPGFLAWPAWLRVLAVTPALALLWLAVMWVHLEAVPF